MSLEASILFAGPWSGPRDSIYVPMVLIKQDGIETRKLEQMVIVVLWNTKELFYRAA